MTPTGTTEEQAKQRVEQLRSFYIHLIAYIAVNVMLIAINAAAGGVWFQWPLLGWGIGLAAHAITVYAPRAPLGAEWEARQLRRLLAEADGREH